MSKINLDALLQDMLDALDVVIRHGEPDEVDRGEQLEIKVLETFDRLVSDIAAARNGGEKMAVPVSLIAFEALRLDVLDIGQQVYQRLGE